ncbi:hypothetical protein Hanom_Chr05g00449671 [Helianthus anomalus]
MKLHSFSYSIPSLLLLSEVDLTEFRYTSNEDVPLQCTRVMTRFRSCGLYIVLVVSLIWTSI